MPPKHGATDFDGSNGKQQAPESGTGAMLGRRVCPSNPFPKRALCPYHAFVRLTERKIHGPHSRPLLLLLRPYFANGRSRGGGGSRGGARGRNQARSRNGATGSDE